MKRSRWPCRVSAGRPGRNCKRVRRMRRTSRQVKPQGPFLLRPVANPAGGIPGLELPQDWYARRLLRTNRESGCLSSKSFLLFAPKVQAMLDTVDWKPYP